MNKTAALGIPRPEEDMSVRYLTSLGDKLGTKLVKVRHVIPEEEVVCTRVPLVVVKSSYIEVAVCTP